MGILTRSPSSASGQISNVPPAQALPPWPFVLSRFLVAAFWLAVLAANELIHHDVHIWTTMHAPQLMPVVRVIDRIAGCFIPVAFLKLA